MSLSIYFNVWIKCTLAGGVHHNVSIQGPQHVLRRAEVMEAVVGKICVVVVARLSEMGSFSRIANNAAAERIPNAKKGVTP